MKIWAILVLSLLTCLASVSLIVGCGDDDDSGGGDDDDGGADDDDGGDDDVSDDDDCAGMCQRGLDCFGEDFWQYSGVGSMDECVQQCEDDLAGADSDMIECILGCGDISDCEDWASCMAACAGY